MCFDSDGYSDVWNETVPKALKPHRCVECPDTIQPGEHYQRVRSLYDGHWDTLITCARCVWDRERVYEHEIAEGCAPSEAMCPHGYLREHMRDVGMEPSPITYRADVAALVGGAGGC